MSPAARILFVRTDRMGDVLMNIPAIRLLRQTYPKSWITVMADQSVAPLLRNQSDIDEVMAVDSAKFENNSSYQKKIREELRKIRFDMAIVSNASKALHWMVFAAGIKRRVGWRRKWGFLLNRSLPDEKAQKNLHEIDSNLSLVKLVSPLSWDGQWNFSANPDVVLRTKNMILRALPEGKKIIAIHAGSSNPQKKWPIEKFIEICKRIAIDQRAVPILIGGREEVSESKRVSSFFDPPLADWTGILSLEELTAFLGSERVCALVSADSGPVHVAWIQQKPVVVFFAKNVPGSNPDRWGPKSLNSRIFYKPLKDLSVDEVWCSVSELLE